MKLPARVLASYGLPALPLAAIYLPVYVFLAPYYAGTIGLSVGAIGAVFIAIRLFDAVSDPIMGWLSDRTRIRGLRRKPWLVMAVPVIMVSAYGLLVPPEGVGIVWFSGFLLALTIGWTMFLTPFFAWGAELSSDYAERGRITVWRETIGLIGTVIAMVLYGTADPGSGLERVALLVVVGLPIATLIALKFAPEKPALAGPPTDLRKLLKALRDEPIFGRLLLAYFLNGAANALPATLFLFFVEFRLGDAGAGGPLLIVYFGAAVLGAPFWIWAGNRFEKHRIWCVAMLYACVVFLSVLTLGTGDIVAFGVISALSGLALGADLALPSAMQADVVDLDTVNSGEQRTGAFFALWSVATKASVALTGGVALLILQAVGFDAQAQNGAGILLTLTLLYALAPVVLKLIAVALMWRFPLDRARQAQLRTQLDNRV